MGVLAKNADSQCSYTTAFSVLVTETEQISQTEI